MKRIAEKHGKSVAQIIAPWDLQKGIITIPKSNHQPRIVANADLYDFELSGNDMKAIDDLDRYPQRFGRDPDNIGF